MLELALAVDETTIQKLANEMLQQYLAEQIVKQYSYEQREASRGIQEAVEKAVKDLIYSRKDEIIEKCIERATAELARKGLPKIIERMTIS